MSTPEPASPAAATPARPARRCNADYRWTVKKVEAFLRALGRCGKVAEAAREVGMSRQSAYRLKARLADPRFRQTFELARRNGRMAREAARVERGRPPSEWGAPGLAAYDYLRGDGLAAQSDGLGAQGDERRPQGDTRSAQGYASPSRRPGSPPQGHALPPQGDGFGREARF